MTFSATAEMLWTTSCSSSLGGTGTPTDFVSFHAKGKPTFVDGHVRMGISAQLAAIDEGFRIIASYPEVKSKPIVIGEKAADGRIVIRENGRLLIRHDENRRFEASGGRVGTSFDKVLMSCYRYDPATRRYAPFVTGFMRIGASMAFLALAGLLAVLWRKELAMKKQRQRAMTAATGRAA